MRFCHAGRARRALWEAAGLRDVETGALVVAADYADFDDYWSLFPTGLAPSGAYCASLDDERRRRAARGGLRRLGSPDGPFSLRPAPGSSPARSERPTAARAEASGRACRVRAHPSVKTGGSSAMLFHIKQSHTPRTVRTGRAGLALSSMANRRTSRSTVSGSPSQQHTTYLVVETQTTSATFRPSCSRAPAARSARSRRSATARCCLPT